MVLVILWWWVSIYVMVDCSGGLVWCGGGGLWLLWCGEERERERQCGREIKYSEMNKKLNIVGIDTKNKNCDVE